MRASDELYLKIRAYLVSPPTRVLTILKNSSAEEERKLYDCYINIRETLYHKNNFKCFRNSSATHKLMLFRA